MSLPVPPEPDGPTPPPWHSLPNAPTVGTLLGQRDALADPSATLHALPLAPEAANPTPFRYLLLRDGDKVHAFVNRCAHFGVPLAAKQEQLIYQPRQSLTCNVHYAKYDWTDGRCLSGECDTESLSPLPLVMAANGELRVAPSAA
ncbi:MAG: Rieske (2Fe-2S) protein [Rhodoferax sp.]|nr:Rieske (2Fe-2S) protein [Rhodoferax sp.]